MIFTAFFCYSHVKERKTKQKQTDIQKRPLIHHYIIQAACWKRYDSVNLQGQSPFEHRDSLKKSKFVITDLVILKSIPNTNMAFWAYQPMIWVYSKALKIPWKFQTILSFILPVMFASKNWYFESKQASRHASIWFLSLFWFFCDCVQMLGWQEREKIGEHTVKLKNPLISYP